MGFRFNRQLHILSSIQQESSLKQHKNKRFNQSKLIHSPVIRSETRRQYQDLSANDRKFLQSIGLKLRKERK
jgi:hypothetical protein